MPTCFRHHLCCPPSVSVHHGRHNFATSVCHQCALCSNAATSHSAAHAATTSSASWTPTKTVTSPTWSSSSRPTTRPTRSSSTGRTRTATAASRASVVFICSVLLSVRPSTAVVAAAVVSSQYGGVVVSFGVVRVRTHACTPCTKAHLLFITKKIKNHSAPCQSRNNNRSHRQQQSASMWLT